MRSLGTLLGLCFGLAVFAAGEARAFALEASRAELQGRVPSTPRSERVERSGCDDDVRDGIWDGVSPVSGLDDHDSRGVVDALEDELVEAILPCAMLESGAVGAWCLDASVYVVTPTGVLLCRTGLAAFDLPSGGTPLLERALPPAGSPPGGADASALATPLLPALPAPLVLELPSALEGRPRPDRPFSPAPPFVPG